MAKKASTPLQNVDLNNINDGLKMANEFGLHCSKAKACGIDTEPFEKQVEHYKNTLNAMKQVYFPNQY